MRTFMEFFVAGWLLALLASVLLGPFVVLAMIVSYIVGLG
jgi:hypothetical protein